MRNDTTTTSTRAVLPWPQVAKRLQLSERTVMSIWAGIREKVASSPGAHDLLRLWDELGTEVTVTDRDADGEYDDE